MRRQLILVATWVAGTTVAVLVAWQAVALVGRQVTESRPAELSRSDLVARLETPGTTATAVAAAPRTTVTIVRPIATTSAPTTTIRSHHRRPSAPTPPHRTGAQAPAAPAPPPPPPPPAATAVPPNVTAPPPADPPAPPPPVTTAPPPPPSSTTTAPPPDPSTTATYALTGGRAQVRCRDSSAELIWATPNSGFAVEVEDSGPEEIDIKFESDQHDSRLKVECDGGEPVPEIEENDDGGSD